MFCTNPTNRHFRFLPHVAMEGFDEEHHRMREHEEFANSSDELFDVDSDSEVKTY